MPSVSLLVSAGAVFGLRREMDATDASGNDGRPFGYSDLREYEYVWLPRSLRRCCAGVASCPGNDGADSHHFWS